MAIHYVIGRDFKGKYKPPKYMVLGLQEGSVFRRVFRSKGHAERFKLKMHNTPRVSQLTLVELPESQKGDCLVVMK